MYDIKGGEDYINDMTKAVSLCNGIGLYNKGEKYRYFSWRILRKRTGPRIKKKKLPMEVSKLMGLDQCPKVILSTPSLPGDDTGRILEQI